MGFGWWGGTTITQFYDFIRLILDDLAVQFPGRRFCFTIANLDSYKIPIILNVAQCWALVHVSCSVLSNRWGGHISVQHRSDLSESVLEQAHHHGQIEELYQFNSRYISLSLPVLPARGLSPLNKMYLSSSKFIKYLYFIS